MKIRQSVWHLATRQALQLPGLRVATTRGMVALHTRVFGERADPAHRAERTTPLEALFDASMDMYLAALQAGYRSATGSASIPASRGSP